MCQEHLVNIGYCKYFYLNFFLEEISFDSNYVRQYILYDNIYTVMFFVILEQ